MKYMRVTATAESRGNYKKVDECHTSVLQCCSDHVMSINKNNGIPCGHAEG